MSNPFKPARIAIALMLLMLACWNNTAFATSRQLEQGPVAGQGVVDLVTLTVTSACGSVNIKLKKNVVLTTPFTVVFPRGKTIQLKAVDPLVPQCDGLTVVTPFKQFLVNQTKMPEGERSVALTLEQDTAVLVQYGTSAVTPVTLSLGSNCFTGANILITETTIGGQSGMLRTHFDAQFPPGRSLRLEAPVSLPACSDLGVVLHFANWSAGGKAYPQNQTAIDLTLAGFTSAYAHYTGVVPTLRINTYHLLHKGIPANYIRVGEEFNEFTLVLTGESFPPGVTVFVINAQAEQAEILGRSNATDIEIRLPPRLAAAPGFTIVRMTSPDSRFSNSVPIEIRRE
jgi:hypothetical protein